MQVIEGCSPWTASAIAAVLTRLTLLSLRDNCLTELAAVLPASAVQSLRVLDLSGNCFGRGPHDHEPPWTANQMAAFASGSWANLQVLGIRPLTTYAVPSGMQAQAHALELLLQQQAADAQPPRPAPIVVYSDLNSELLRPSDKLAVVA